MPGSTSSFGKIKQGGKSGSLSRSRLTVHKGKTKMGILKKLVLGISLMLVIAFTVVTFVINIGVGQNNDALVSSILAKFEHESNNSVKIMNTSIQTVANKLQGAGDTTQKIILRLYTSSYNALVLALASQIYPLIESFDFDAADKIAGSMLETTKAVKWIRYTTSTDPTPSDIHEFGEKTSDAGKLLTYQIKGDLAFLNIEMQVSLAEMQALQEVEEIFSAINRENQQLASRVETSGRQSLVNAKESAVLISQKGKKKLFQKIGAFMVLMLALVCLSILYFIRQWVTIPVSKIAAGLKDGANLVASSSGQIASASQSLAEGTSEQAASLEETTASLEEMTAMSKTTSEMTLGAEQLMNENIEKSGQSLKAMVDLTRKMAQIEADSDQIGQIIKTINAIAFQTNLLALNAAVEAARAGKAGAGFAVVAGEVRNLAIRATEAAENTQELLDGTIKRVGESAQAIKAMNSDFEGIIESATVMGEKTDAITAASKEQTKRIEQISQAAREMDIVTQQNAASSEESASAAEELSAMSEEMKIIVNDLTRIVYGSKKGIWEGINHQAEVSCWEVKNCPDGRRKKCPAYPDHGSSCWMVTATLCGGEEQGSFREKMANCRKCDLYLLANASTQMLHTILAGKPLEAIPAKDADINRIQTSHWKQ